MHAPGGRTQDAGQKNRRAQARKGTGCRHIREYDPRVMRGPHGPEITPRYVCVDGLPVGQLCAPLATFLHAGEDGLPAGSSFALFVGIVVAQSVEDPDSQQAHQKRCGQQHLSLIHI